MKYIFITLLIIGALVYFGIIKFNSSSINSGIKSTVDKTIDYAKKGYNEIQKANTK